jgi:hypothetical protein
MKLAEKILEKKGADSGVELDGLDMGMIKSLQGDVEVIATRIAKENGYTIKDKKRFSAAVFNAFLRGTESSIEDDQIETDMDPDLMSDLESAGIVQRDEE